MNSFRSAATSAALTLVVSCANRADPSEAGTETTGQSSGAEASTNSTRASADPSTSPATGFTTGDESTGTSGGTLSTSGAETTSTNTSSGSDDDTGREADPFDSWGNAERVIALGPASSPSLTADLAEIYFTDDLARIMVAHRFDRKAEWELPEAVNLGSLVVPRFSPFLSPDGLTLYYNQEGNLHSSSRPDLDTEFVAGAPVWNTDETEFGAAVTESGLLMVVSRFSDAGNADLYVSERPSTAVGWPYPTVPTREVNSNSADACPWIDTEGTTLVFCSRRGGTVHRDLYVSRLDEGSGGWSTPLELESLNTPEDETDPWIAPDGETIYFSASPDPATEPLFIYRASRL